MEKFINILYFNFCLLTYYFGMCIVIYFNPFCWAANIKYFKLGFKIWKRQMEKNHPLFLYQMKYDQNVKFISYQWFMLFISMLIFLIAGLLQFFVKKFYILGFILFLISYVGSYFYVFNKDKYYEYQKEFMKNKKYTHPIILLILWILLAAIIYIVFFRKFVFI
jgi:uncharacterized membrane-anchored protein